MRAKRTRRSRLPPRLEGQFHENPHCNLGASWSHEVFKGPKRSHPDDGDAVKSSKRPASPGRSGKRRLYKDHRGEQCRQPPDWMSCPRLQPTFSWMRSTESTTWSFFYLGRKANSVTVDVVAEEEFLILIRKNESGSDTEVKVSLCDKHWTCSCSSMESGCDHVAFVSNKWKRQNKKRKANICNNEKADTSDRTQRRPECRICFSKLTVGSANSKCDSSSCHLTFHQTCWAVWKRHRARHLAPGCPSCATTALSNNEIKRKRSPSSSTLTLRTASTGQMVIPSRTGASKQTMDEHSRPSIWETCEDIYESFGMGSDACCQNSGRSSDSSVMERHWRLAQGWAAIFGRELANSLVSKDWVVREMSLKRLMKDLLSALRTNYTTFDSRLWRSTAEVLAKVADEEKVCKVYLAALRCLRILLVFTKVSSEDNQVHSMIKASVRPIVKGILSKCADGNKRLAEMSLDTILEFCKGADGRLGLGRYAPGDQMSTYILGIDFILEIILEDVNSTGMFSNSKNNLSWQPVLGRLIAMEEIVASQKNLFLIPSNQESQTGKDAPSPQYYRTMVLVDFSFRHLGSIHPNVNKRSRDLFVRAAKMSLGHSETCAEVVQLLTILEPTLQQRMLRRLKDAFFVRNLSSKMASSTSLTSCSSVEQSLGFLDSVDASVSTTKTATSTSRLNRSISHSPSRRDVSISHIPRDTSQSPARLSPISRVKMKKRAAFKKSATPSNGATSQGSFAHNTMQLFDTCLPFIPGLSDLEYLNHQQLEDLQEEVREKVGGSEFWQKPCKNETGEPISLPLTFNSASEVVPNYQEGVDWLKGNLLGAGAYSTCYQARDVKTGVLMAVKQVSISALGSDSDLRQMNKTNNNRFECRQELVALAEAEVNLLRRLQHPHIVRMFGAVRHQNHINIFVEWMPGGSVAGLLDRFGPFENRVIENFTLQTLLGLEYLHSWGVLHRDLKGANLLVDSTGCHLRIGDVGSAAKMENLTNTSQSGGDFGLQGTIAFMAPEVLRGEHYDHTCDIWSIGCCIIEMATAKPPWNASDVSNHLALIFKIACSVTPPPIPSHLSTELKNVASLCLNLHPHQRPSAKTLMANAAFHDL